MTKSLHIEIDGGSTENRLLDALKAAFELTWKTAALKQNEFANEIGLKIIEREEMQQLNKQFLNKDYATNVLSFPSAPLPGIPDTYLGDIAICTAVVEQEAAEQKITPIAHWTHLAIHGLLHLMGYDHETDSEAEEMESLEIQILEQLDWPNPYQSY